jgi:hypothetical protein
MVTNLLNDLPDQGGGTFIMGDILVKIVNIEILIYRPLKVEEGN